MNAHRRRTVPPIAHLAAASLIAGACVGCGGDGAPGGTAPVRMPEFRNVAPAAVPPGEDFRPDAVVHVDVRHVRASDDNEGTAEAPLRSIGEAVQRALSNKQRFRSTLVAVHPGTYREAVRLGAYTNYRGKPANTTPLVVEAVEPGTAVVSGSDVWRDWRVDAETGSYVHAWPHDWGVAPDPTRGQRALREIVLRRELLFVDGERYRQVLSADSLEAGSFFVDEKAGRVFVQPPAGTRLEQTVVEVGERDVLWDQEWEDHVAIRGLVFRHAPTPWEDGRAAVRISSSRQIVIEDVRVRWNNGTGVYVGQSEAVTMRRVRMDHNGWDGLRMWRVRDAVVEDGTTSANNWRGHRGGYYSWSVGNKIHNVHGLVLRRHAARDNYSRGLWLDEDNRDVLLEDVELSGNLGDGLFLEANPGPIRIVQSRLEGNGVFGLRAANTEQVHMTGCTLARNGEGGIELTGNDDGRDVRDYASGETYRLYAQTWVLEENSVASGRVDAPLVHTTLGKPAWERFVRSFASDQNAWRHPDLERAFALPLFSIGRLSVNGSYGPDAWRNKTGNDRRSVFSEVGGVGS